MEDNKTNNHISIKEFNSEFYRGDCSYNIPTDAWYEQHLSDAYHNLSDSNKPFCTEILVGQTVEYRFYPGQVDPVRMRNACNFSVGVHVFESNEDLMKFVSYYGEDKLMDIVYRNHK